MPTVLGDEQKGREMRIHKISDRVYAIHADIKSDDLFEGIWPIPYGVSLNSYIVMGEKIAVIDLVRDWVGAPAEFSMQLASIGLEAKDIDYLVLNHLEPDHTGWLAEFKALNPHVEILATAKGIELVKSFYKIEDGLRTVKTGDTLDLGNGVQLTFIEAPNVHWPETMLTWDERDRVLFTCDAFGSFGSLGDRIFDDEFNDEEHKFFESEGLRYYANIVASFGVFVARAIEKAAKLDIGVIAPSHGIVWRQDPYHMVKQYSKYAGYLEGPREKEIAVIWGSMYGNTEKGLTAALQGIEDVGVPYTIHRVPNEDVSWVLADAYKSEGILIAMPTYEYRVFPPMAYALSILERKHVFNRKALRIGSYGWVGGAKKEYENLITPLHWQSIEPVEWAGAPSEETLGLLYQRGQELARAVDPDKS